MEANLRFHSYAWVFSSEMKAYNHNIKYDGVKQNISENFEIVPNVQKKEIRLSLNCVSNNVEQ